MTMSLKELTHILSDRANAVECEADQRKARVLAIQLSEILERDAVAAPRKSLGGVAPMLDWRHKMSPVDCLGCGDVVQGGDVHACNGYLKRKQEIDR